MFDLLKEDIMVGQKIKLYLTTGKEIEGTIITIGVNYLLLTEQDSVQRRIFDKLIGGWETENSLSSTISIKNSSNELYENNANFNINVIRKNVDILLKISDDKILNTIIEPNGNIIHTRGTTCIATTDKDQKVLIINSKILDIELVQEIENFEVGSIIPVFVKYYIKKNNDAISTLTLKPQTIGNLLKKLLILCEANRFSESKVLLNVIKLSFKANKHIRLINEELKLGIDNYSKTETKKIDLKYPENEEKKKIFKNIEKEINDTIRVDGKRAAISKIEKHFYKNILDIKYKSILLLKKAQLYSSIDEIELAESSYEELIEFNKKNFLQKNNLSHLYTELARIQSIHLDKQNKALESLRIALDYNDQNNFAINLQKQLINKKTSNNQKSDANAYLNENLLIADDEEVTNISRMIYVDIQEHKYSRPEIFRNQGKITPTLAKSILDEARKMRKSDLVDSYPVYLEAAKMFSELNVGSYDLQDYLEAVAYYAIMKGNFLFISFKNKVLNKSSDNLVLTRLKDSACSYYIESLNLLSNIDSQLLDTLLTNYLKLNVIIYYIKNNNFSPLNALFETSLSSLLLECIRSDRNDIEVIAYKTIVDYGASSVYAWNSLYLNVTNVLYSVFTSRNRTVEIYKLLNDMESNSLDYNLKPNEFLKRVFLERRKKTSHFIKKISIILTIELEAQNIDTIIRSWNKIEDFERYINPTDSEVKRNIDIILTLLQPYLNRNEKERINILIQVRKIVEKQLKFINENTTFYSRTFFYSLLSGWKNSIDLIIEEKISQSYPNLSVHIDPPYYIRKDDEINAPFLIRNDGDATADGFILSIFYKLEEQKEPVKISSTYNVEISSNGKIETNLILPQKLLDQSEVVELKVHIQAIYQNKELTPKTFGFTIEKEPESSLNYEDIPWRDGPIPPEHLFKGRKKLIADLAQHYLSIDKDKPYILYGLTRTGKSSILEYLGKNIEGNTFTVKGREKLVLTFSWDLSVAASHKKASDFWEYIIYQRTYEEIEKYSLKYDFEIKNFNISENARLKDFKTILDFFETNNLYPIFFIDEFSFIKTIIDEKTTNTAFLHTLRQFALNDKASFIFAGTYDIKVLMKDSRYGITGQLVNAIEEQVNEISNSSANELIEVINHKLSFTNEAKEHIRFLSGNVPYFIQIICKYCGYYAAENKRRYIGYPELEKVIKVLIGQEFASPKSLIKKLSETTFQNNQFSPTDPKEVAVLISSIAHLNKDQIADPRGVGFGELQKLWAEKKVNAFRPKLAEAIDLLKEKRIIIQSEDEGGPVYKLSVDLFRRWWANHNQDIDLTITTLSE